MQDLVTLASDLYPGTEILQFKKKIYLPALEDGVVILQIWDTAGQERF